MSDVLESDANAGGGGSAATPSPSPERGATPPPAAGSTIVSTDENRQPITAAGDWPQDWRQKFAGDDQDALKQLDRFKSPLDLAKSYRELQKKLSSGDAKAKPNGPPPKDAAPEQVAAWRKENGIPETPEGYKVELPNGVVFGEADKPLLGSFTAHAHARNWSPQLVNEAMEWYADFSSKQSVELQKRDDQAKFDGMNNLIAEWGLEYTRNKQAIVNYLGTVPNGLGQQILEARGADGNKLGNTPAMLQWLADLANMANPMASLVPPGTHDVGKTLAAERDGLLKQMRTDRKAYEERGGRARLMEIEEAMAKAPKAA